MMLPEGSCADLRWAGRLAYPPQQRAAADEPGAVHGEEEQVAVGELERVALEAGAECRDAARRALVAEALDVVPVLVLLDADLLGQHLDHPQVGLVADEA